MTNYTVTVPQGSPDDITTAAGKLKKAAGDLDKHSTMITAEQHGMSTSWHGDGGKAAATEAGTVGSSATTYSGYLNDGANALTTFAKALGTARTNIGKLKSQADKVPGEARTEASSHTIYPHLPPSDQQDWVNSIIDEKMTPIMTSYHQEQETLKKAGQTCKNALTKNIPGYSGKLTPAQIANQTAKSLESKLPILHAHNQAVTFTKIMSDGKITDDERKQLASIGHDLATHKNDNPYLEEFYSGIPAGSMQKVPLALHNNHKDGPILTDGDKDIIGDFGTSLAALSRIGGVHNKGEGYNLATRALGNLQGDMPGLGMLFKYSTRNGRSGQWNSVLSADSAEAALLWRQQHPSYYYAQGSYSGQIYPNGGGKDGEDYWFKDWGMKWGDDSIKEFDPTLNILGNINQNHDDWAARKIASDPLPKNLPLNYAVPDGMSHNGGNTGTFVDLMVVPDWLDNGTAAGNTLKLATETVRTGDEGRVSAHIMQDIMKDTAWWENHKGDVQKTAKDNYAAISGFGIDNGNDWKNFDLGSGMKQDLGHMAVQYIPSLASDKHAHNGDHAYIDPVTGQMNIDMDGSTVTDFMKSFIGDKKDRVTLLGAAEEWARRGEAYGLQYPQHGDNALTAQQAAQRSGWLYGNIATSYGDVTNQDAKDAKSDIEGDLKFARDAFTTVTGFAGPEATLPNFAFTKYTDAMFADYDNKYQAQLDAAAKQSAAFSDDVGGNGYATAASAAYLSHRYDNQQIDIADGPNGEHRTIKYGDCFNADGSIKPQYASDVESWIHTESIDLSKGGNGTDPITGSKLVGWYESAFNNQ